MNFLDDMERQITWALHGRLPDADQVAQVIAAQIRNRWAGEQVYIRVGRDHRAEALAMIRDGVPPAKVARRVGVHVATVYRWRAACR
jgi:DNA invertase Pin-like site-specific DNA recombinase